MTFSKRQCIDKLTIMLLTLSLDPMAGKNRHTLKGHVSPHVWFWELMTIYGLMCKLSFTCRFVHWHLLGHVLVSRLKYEEEEDQVCLEEEENEVPHVHIQGIILIMIEQMKGKLKM